MTPFLPLQVLKVPQGVQGGLHSSSPSGPPFRDWSLWRGAGGGGKLGLSLFIWKMGRTGKLVVQDHCGHEMSM